MECEWCEGPDGEETVDPFTYEIYGDETPVIICGDCFTLRADEI